MKILHVIYDDPNNPWVGGGGALRTWTINAFLAPRHHITVLTGMYPGAARQEQQEGVTILRIGAGRSYLLSRLSFAWEARRAISSIPHDLLVEEFSGNSPTFAPRWTSRPSIAVIQNRFAASIIRKHPFMGWASWWYERTAIRMFDAFIPVSAPLAEWVASRCPGKPYEIIPQGLSDLFLRPRRRRERYILFVGRLDVYQKGLDLLLAAYQTLPRHRRPPLWIVGGQDERSVQALQREIRRRNLSQDVTHHPKVPPERMPSIYADALFLCQPSRYEGWPLVCLESFSQGKPVLCTDIPGFRDVVTQERTGLKVPPDNVPALAQAMRKLLDNPALRHRLGREGERFARRFSWSRLADRQERFYASIVHSRRTR